jgi:hypothetical protein
VWILYLNQLSTAVNQLQFVVRIQLGGFFESVCEKGGSVMITQLRAQNFKSWQDTGTLQLAPLTGLFGANNSGKTSILQVLLMLKQTVEHPSPDWNEPLYFGDEYSLVNLGSFDDIIHRPINDQSLGISVFWKHIEPYSVNSLFFSTFIDKKDKQPHLAEFCYTANRQDFRVKWTPQGYRFKSGHDSIRADLFRCYGVTSPTGPLEPFFRCREAFEKLFSRILYLGPLREHPRPRYLWEGDHPKGVGRYGEQAMSAMLSGRVRRFPIDEHVPKWLQRLKLIDSYRLDPVSDTGKNYEFLVKQYKDGPEVRLTDVGFGVSQVLPVLILCYSAPEGSILILEQPEAHLHPSAQSELGDVLVDVVKNRNVQIILESHSAFMLHRLQRRIAEEQISETDTALYFCQINDGTSEIERLKLDEYGNISNWPQNFFGDDVGDLVEKTKAEMKRRKVME